MPKILDYETFCEELDEVTSLKTFSKRKFHPNGLFSEQIFGPVRNYTCQCGKYYGVSKKGGKCDLCKVDIVNSDERRKRFAKITLPIPVVNPLFYDMLVNLSGKNFKKALDDLMRNDKSILYITNDEIVVTADDDSIPTDARKWERAEAIYELVKNVATDAVEDGILEWETVLKNINNLLIDKVIVLPPDLRPTSKSSGESKQLMDKINRYYTQILTKKEIMRETIIDIHRDKALYYTYFKQLQKDVNELYTRILEKMAKKEGLIRGNILGKRIDFSGRAVITPDPTLSLDECKLPYLMVLEIFKLPIAKRILELGKFKLLNKAIDFVDECIDKNNPVLYKVCETVTNGEYCILNRQPSLHKLGMLAFKIRLTLNHVIKIHPLVCSPFNADFDGDQMAVYIPITNEAKKEAVSKISITNNLYSPANESLTTTPSQDVILGIYYLTSPTFNGNDKKEEFKGEQMTLGEIEFNQNLPDDYPPIKGVVAKGRLMGILNDIKDNYSNEEVVRILDNIKRIGFKHATLFGCTMSLDDFSLERVQELRDEIYSKDETRDQLVAFSDSQLVDQLKDEFKYAYMIESGARGSWDQVKQLILSRGFISNFDGEIIPQPIKHSLVEGLTPEEFFSSTYGCRKGLLDVALNTGTSGYLSRKLIFTCANLQIDLDCDDCGTEDFLSVDVKTKRKANMLVNKYYKVGNQLELITKDNCEQLIGKEIEVRSPILCKNPKICKKCYGKSYRHLNSRFIGIIAAQTLGERGTQLVLRTFHTCLRKNTQIVDINKNIYSIQEVYNIVKQGLPFYTFSCSPSGEIEVCRVIDVHKDRLENKYIRITLDNGEYFECSLDHKVILRDGSEILAEKLQINDSLMPLYFGEKRDGYRTVRQNFISKFHKNERLDLIYKLSSKHPDTLKHDKLDITKKITRHHCDKKKYNDYPNNIILMNEKYHLPLHSSDGVKYRARKIYEKLTESKLELTIENFNIINKQLYPNPKARWGIKAIEKLSPGCLDYLKNNHKVINIEIIDLPKYEEFYDLTVDSECQNFPLACGVFVHNSGSAVIKGEQNTEDPTMKQKDIIGDLASVAQLLHKFKEKTYTDIVEELFDVYDKNIYHVHFECVVTQLMWKNYRKWRLIPDRDKVTPDYYSVQSVPNQESWILAMAFSNPKRSILQGILYEGRYSGVMDKILKGEKIT